LYTLCFTGPTQRLALYGATSSVYTLYTLCLTGPTERLALYVPRLQFILCILYALQALLNASLCTVPLLQFIPCTPYALQALLNASLCTVPAGDTPSSRRLFDVLSAGCVPVLMRSWYTMRRDNHSFATSLPFPSLIDWQAVSLWLAPVVRTATKSGSERCALDAVSWLEAWLLLEPRRLAERRRLARAVFREHLDYGRNPVGVASALLHEVKLRVRACETAPPAQAADVRAGRRTGRPPEPRKVLQDTPIDDPDVCPWPQQAAVMVGAGAAKREAAAAHGVGAARKGRGR